MGSTILGEIGSDAFLEHCNLYLSTGLPKQKRAAIDESKLNSLAMIEKNKQTNKF
jgi:hypothetical protein